MTDAQVCYLETDQFRLGGGNACAWCATYCALYLCYSPAPRRDDLVEHMRRACSDWRRTRRLSRLAQDSAAEAHGAHRVSRLLLHAREDWFGVNVPASVDRAQLAPPERDEAGFSLVVGLGELVRRLVKRANADLVDVGTSLAAVFSSRGSTLCVAVRRASVGRLRFDLVDSHGQSLSIAPRPEFSAVWVSTSSPSALADLLAELYPPSPDGAEEARAFFRSGDDLEATARGSRVPRSFFSVSLFYPRWREAPRDLDELDRLEREAEQRDEDNRRRVALLKQSSSSSGDEGARRM